MNSELAALLPKLGPNSFWDIQPTILPGHAYVSLFVNRSFIDKKQAVSTVEAIARVAAELAKKHASLIATSGEYVDQTIFGTYS